MYGNNKNASAAESKEAAYFHLADAVFMGKADKNMRRKKRRRTRPIEFALTALSLAIIFMLGIILAAVIGVGGAFGSLFTPQNARNNPPENSFSVISVAGTIGSQSSGFFGTNPPSYLHGATLGYIKQLEEDDGNKGILLYMNTPGGGVFESDEAYRALVSYKEKTGRPIWVYMHNTCASGGYYIAMAADKLVANHNSTTGSIGVYIQLTDTSELYGNIGVETVLVRSGENKGIGVDGTVIDSGNRAVYQSIVDEKYEHFLSLVMQGRGMSESVARPLCDGRPYTAKQALDNGLVDELSNWKSTVAAFEDFTGGSAYHTNFSTLTGFDRLVAGAEIATPKSETEVIFEKIEDLPSGVPLCFAPGLGW